MNKQSTSNPNRDEECIANLKRIYRLIKIDQHQSGGLLGLPIDLDQVYLEASEPKPLICPNDNNVGGSTKPGSHPTSYEVVNDPRKPDLSRIPPEKIAIIAERRPNHNGRRFVLFYDGSVRTFDSAQFDKLKDNSFVDMETRKTSKIK
jgi:prepilin-type processing-associated H-X9-DG protein